MRRLKAAVLGVVAGLFPAVSTMAEPTKQETVEYINDVFESCPAQPSVEYYDRKWKRQKGSRSVSTFNIELDKGKLTITKNYKTISIARNSYCELLRQDQRLDLYSNLVGSDFPCIITAENMIVTSRVRLSDLDTSVVKGKITCLSRPCLKWRTTGRHNSFIGTPKTQVSEKTGIGKSMSLMSCEPEMSKLNKALKHLIKKGHLTKKDDFFSK